MVTRREDVSVPDGRSIILSYMNCKESQHSYHQCKTDTFNRIREVHPVLEAMQDLYTIRGKRIYPRKIVRNELETAIEETLGLRCLLL
jgi:hypothetical protein